MRTMKGLKWRAEKMKKENLNNYEQNDIKRNNNNNENNMIMKYK